MTTRSYKIEDWQSLLCASRTTIWRMVKSESLPKPDTFIGKSPRWLPATVDKYLAANGEVKEAA